MHGPGCTRVLGQQHHGIAYATDHITHLQAGTQSQQRELARPIIQSPVYPRTGDDVHRPSTAIHGNEHP